MRIASVVETRDEYLAFECAAAAATLVHDVLEVRAGQQVLVTCDTRSDMRVAQATACAVAAARAVPMVLTYPSAAAYGGAPPRAVAAAVGAADVWIEFALGHLIYTDAWRAATAAGVQYVSLGGLDVDGFVRCVGRQDVRSIAQVADLLAARLCDAKVRLRSQAGSELEFGTQGATLAPFRMKANSERRAIMLAGQLTLSLGVEESMSGVLVADGILSPPAEVGLIATPVRFDVQLGRIVSISGGREADLLRAWLDARSDPTLLRTAHISFGFNPGIPAPTGRPLEDERAFGDVDFGWGAWIDRPATGHFDFTCRAISHEIDGAPIMVDGVFVDPDLAALAAGGTRAQVAWDMERPS